MNIHSTFYEHKLANAKSQEKFNIGENTLSDSIF